MENTIVPTNNYTDKNGKSIPFFDLTFSRAYSYLLRNLTTLGLTNSVEVLKGIENSPTKEKKKETASGLWATIFEDLSSLKYTFNLNQ